MYIVFSLEEVERCTDPNHPSEPFRSPATTLPSVTPLPSTLLLSTPPTTFLTSLPLTTTVSALTLRLPVRLPGTPRVPTPLPLKSVPRFSWMPLPSLRPRSPIPVSLALVTLKLSALVLRLPLVPPLILPSSMRTLTSSALLSPLKTRLASKMQSNYFVRNLTINVLNQNHGSQQMELCKALRLVLRKGGF
jgi:hypothetical protein